MARHGFLFGMSFFLIASSSVTLGVSGGCYSPISADVCIAHAVATRGAATQMMAALGTRMRVLWKAEASDF